MGPISHSEVSSGRVEFGKRLVMGMAPIAMALISDTHPVSERRRAEGRGEVREKRGGTHATGKVHRCILRGTSIGGAALSVSPERNTTPKNNARRAVPWLAQACHEVC